MAADDPKEREYEGYRRAARAATEAAIHRLVRAGAEPGDLPLGIRLTAIDDRALARVAEQWSDPRFPWRRVCGQFRPFVRRFEVAIWAGPSVEGLCIGKASRGTDNVTIHFLERRPGGRRLRGYIAQLATDAADAYARVIGRRRLKLRDPVEEAIPLDEALDFTLAETQGPNTYYERNVEP